MRLDSPPPDGVRLTDVPALVAGVRSATWRRPDGRVEILPLDESADRAVNGPPPLVCHARATAARLGIGSFQALDVLELFAFVRPARFCLPTPRGVAEVLGVPLPESPRQEVESLALAAEILLAGLTDLEETTRTEALGTAWAMARGGWPWGTRVLAALRSENAPHSAAANNALRIWLRLPEWQERSAEVSTGDWPVEPVEARARLVRLLGGSAEDRSQQAEYASQVSAAFAPRDHAGEPRVVLAEAGTGVGKTLGYVAPASVWVEKNGMPVWISTFTRNLQRQLDAELDRLYPDPSMKAARVVIRKGRENYFCLLNFDEAITRLAARSSADTVALGLMARWGMATRDGDMVGGDFPGWLSHLLGARLTVDLTDTRGECIYSACPHFRKCFVERSIRRARSAEVVVANHALVLAQAALGGEDVVLPSRYVFDEGHHLFDAADSAFSAHLSGRETADLRRWLLGAETRRGSRSRGLQNRIGDLVAERPAAAEALEDVLTAARTLPASGWRQRLITGTPTGPAEAFLARVRQQVFARAADTASPYGLEVHTEPLVPGLLEAAEGLESALENLGRPLTALIAVLKTLLDTEADNLETATRVRIESVCRSLVRRGIVPLSAWRAMLDSLKEETPAEFVDWFSVEREGDREADTGLHRHWVDPMQPFAGAVLDPAHGVVITSASLRDGTGEADVDWAVADLRTGARHIGGSVQRTSVNSPFDYVGQTRVLVVTDVSRDAPRQVAAAYRELFVAAGGGGLGLFTAIARLREVYDRIAGPLEAAGLPLFAQHVDRLDTGTLVDIFRAEERSCLLGTDAVRDGVDVPGPSLHLIVFERVPWARPTILHRARKEAFGGRAYDEMIARLRLKQAYGRLIRRSGDRGVFVMLDRAFPSRLANAFPEGVAVRRVGLAEAIAETRGFLVETD